MIYISVVPSSFYRYSTFLLAFIWSIWSFISFGYRNNAWMLGAYIIKSISEVPRSIYLFLFCISFSIYRIDWFRSISDDIKDHISHLTSIICLLIVLKILLGYTIDKIFNVYFTWHALGNVLRNQSSWDTAVLPVTQEHFKLALQYVLWLKKKITCFRHLSLTFS